jgi:hypothetical protein
MKITTSQLRRIIQEEIENTTVDEGFMSTLKKGVRKMRGKGMMASDATKRSQEKAHEMVKYLEQVALASYQNATGGGTGPSPEDVLKAIQVRANQLVDASPGGHKIANQLGELVVGLAKSASNLAINAANEGQKIKFDQLQAKLAQRVPGKGTSLAAKLAEKYAQVLDSGGSWGTS